MLDSALIQVAIGLVLIYFVFSVFCSAGVELLSTWEWTNRFSFVKSRSSVLRSALEKMLGLKLCNSLYNHPLIACQSYQNVDVTEIEKEVKKSVRISYISSSNFSQALCECIIDSLATGREKEALENGGPSLLPNAEEAETIVTNLQNATGYMGRSRVLSDAEMDERRIELNNPDKDLQKLLDIGRAMTALVRRSFLLQKEPLGGIELWYKECMDRVSGWYRRQAGSLIIGFSVIVSVSMNVDTFRITKLLWTDSDSRAVLVASAIRISQDTTYIPSSSFNHSEKEALQQSKALKAEIDKLPLPIGWASETQYRNLLRSNELAMLPDSTWGTILKWIAYGILKMLGWTLSALACSVGAPFWFDLLNRITQLRVTGTKPTDPVANN